MVDFQHGLEIFLFSHLFKLVVGPSSLLRSGTGKEFLSMKMSGQEVGHTSSTSPTAELQSE